MSRIARVEPHLLSYPFPEPLHLDYYGGHRIIYKRDAMLIRVVTDTGEVGFAPGQGSESAQKLIRETIGPWLEGKAFADPDALRIRFLDGPGRDPHTAKIYSTVEVALYDLAAKAAGVPISELLGGRVRDKIRLYGSAGMYMSPEGYADEAAEVVKLGFKAYKMRPGIGPEADLRAIQLIRDRLGPGIDLMVDAHTWWRMGDKSYSPETVKRLAQSMSEQNLCWLEEPMSPHKHELYRALHAEDIIPLASGEHETTEEGFLDLIHGPCVDFVQADIVCQGGYAWGRRLFAALQEAELRFAFHSWGSYLEIIAAAQLGICWPEHVVEWLEYPLYRKPGQNIMYPFPLAEEILKEPLQIVDGELIVPRSPGLGVEINEGVIEKYPWKPGPWSTFTLHSPAGTWAVYNDHSVQWVEDGGSS
ncbi:mandelate racemase/muconate lactonizing enzyme family protein [Bryobacter aggregatus]|uniref:mandelate racemase/muconate lactonizing enzyme family protein n=1 Tax=Bryobacter aggregatus TaxID=360054 RepID=UPI00068EAABF|nr:mandelate racemase/muconate lactonizing enzyme family protein [Bryobacter aggregatus]